MIPKSRRAAILAHDAALDQLAVDLYRSTNARRAALVREVADMRTSLDRLLGGHPLAAGDLRRSRS
jgi:hypothetical protein